MDRKSLTSCTCTMSRISLIISLKDVVLNPTVQVHRGYCLPAVDPEQGKEHEKRAEPKVFHVRIAHFDPHTHPR